MLEIENEVRDYRNAAMGTDLSIPREIANKNARELHTHYLTLRQSTVGREAIKALMSEENANVRLWAARHSLEWVPDVAAMVLEELSSGGGLFAFTAEMTLTEYKKGRLKFGPAAGGKAADGED